MNSLNASLAFYEPLLELFERAESLVMTLPRLYAMFLVVPFLSAQVLRGGVRHALVFMLAVFMAPAIGELPPLTVDVVLMLVAKEALIGLMLGLGFGVFLWAVESVGDLIDVQTGSGNAAFFDPVAGHERGPTSQFLSWTVITLFVSVGGLLTIFATVLDSFRLWPVAQWLPNLADVLHRFAIYQGDQLFTWVIKLGAPVLLVLLLMELGVGLVNRFVPSLDVFTFAQSIKSVLAIFMQLLFMFFLYDSLKQFLQPGNGVIDNMKHLLMGG